MLDKLKNQSIGNGNKSVNWVVKYFELISSFQTGNDIQN